LLDSVALLILLVGLNLVIWGSLVAGWALAAIAFAKLMLTLVSRWRIRRRDDGGR
jgi:hypothetical protein